MKQTWKFVLFIILAAGCASNPYSKTNKAYRDRSKQLAKTLRDIPPVLAVDSIASPAYAVGTTNFDLRRPNFVIIHHTAQNSCDQTLRTFTLARTQVSAHYVICKDGVVHHMLNDYLRAWQAGVSRWGNFSDINSSSIGIEIDNNGYEPFSVPQINSLMHLLDTLKRKYSIPTPNFIGHSDVAPGRKVDPNKFFPWQMLAQNGYGLWYDTAGVSVPPYFNSLQALRIIGYNIKDSVAAIQSFKLHFIQSDTTKALNKEDKKVLFDLARRYM